MSLKRTGYPRALGAYLWPATTALQTKGAASNTALESKEWNVRMIRYKQNSHLTVEETRRLSEKRY